MAELPNIPIDKTVEEVEKVLSLDVNNLSDAIKSDVSGSVVRIDDVSSQQHELQITVQAKDNTDNLLGAKLFKYGKNLLTLPYSNDSALINGVQFAVSNSGTVNAKGTATADARFLLRASSPAEQRQVLYPGTYFVSGCPANGSASTYYMGGFGYQDFGEGYTFNIKEKTSDWLYIMVKEGTTISATFKPMIEVGSQKTDFEPTKGIQEYALEGNSYIENINSLKSLYPTTTIVSDVGTANVDIEYNKSLEKIVDEVNSKIDRDIAEVKNEISYNVPTVLTLTKNNATERRQGEYITRQGFSSYNAYDSYLYSINTDSQIYFADSFAPNYCYVGVLDEGATVPVTFCSRNIDSAVDTLPRENSKLQVVAGQTVVVSVIAKATDALAINQEYEVKETVKEQVDKLQNSVAALSERTQKMYYSKTGDQIDVYVASCGNTHLMHYVYKKDVNASTNLDTWRFYSYEIVDENFNRLFGTASRIEMDSVVREPNAADFVGGYHGYENMSIFTVMVDGHKIDLTADIALTEFFNEIRFGGTSTIYRHGTTEALFTRYKVNVFDKKGYLSKQRWVALQGVTLNTAYMGMMSLPVSEGDIRIANTARMDNNYLEQTHDGELVENGPLIASKDVRQIEIYGNNLYGRATYKSDYGDKYRAFCDRFQAKQFKCYFDEAFGGATIPKNGVINGEMCVEFIF